MSELRGKGYGDQHNWKSGDTEQSAVPMYRSTLWTCSDCNEGFKHFYHQCPDIFDAMKQAGIKEICVGKKVTLEDDREKLKIMSAYLDRYNEDKLDINRLAIVIIDFKETIDDIQQRLDKLENKVF